MACFFIWRMGAGLLDGGTRSHVCWVGRGLYTGVYYANLSILHLLKYHQPEDGHKRRNMWLRTM